MKAALIVPEIFPDVTANLRTIRDMTDQAAQQGTDLVLFPEACLTGLINNDDPAHDLPLGQPIPGPLTDKLAALAQRHGLWLAIGLMERAGSRLFDSALLFTPQGQMGLHYRRIHPGWHGRKADPSVYGHGVDIPCVKTPLGRFAFLICGDLFDNDLIERIRGISPDWLLFPFAREFADRSNNQERWDRSEQAEYTQRIRHLGVPALMANYLAGPGLPGDHSFGGALAVWLDGTVLASWPLGKPGMLILDISIQ